jgi:pyruvate formate lyase activating enzyme
VLDTLIWLKRETDIWLEITTLLIPDENDTDDELKLMCNWIIENLGEEVPLHFTAFHPDFKLLSKPRTPHQTLIRAREIALAAGIMYCYLGNIHDKSGSSTYCHNCHNLLIERDWHSITMTNIKSNQCPKCGAGIPGRFK